MMSSSSVGCGGELKIRESLDDVVKSEKKVMGIENCLMVEILPG
jgi:hypothetical protein